MRQAKKTMKVAKNYGPLLLCGAVLLAVGALAFFGDRQSPQAPKAKKLAPTPVSVGQTFPVLRPIGHPDLSMIMKFLVQNHPAPEIYNDLNSRVIKGDLSLNWQTDIMMSVSLAGFMVVPDQNGALIKVLGVNPDSLRDPNLPDAYWQLVIFHEYQHLRQYELNLSRPQDFGLARAKSNRGEKEIRIWFSHEIDAYMEECRFALRMGWTGLLDLCEVYAKGGGKKAMVGLYAEKVAKDPTWGEADRRLILELGKAE